MKWFKHENTFNNPKIEVLKEKFGAIGYGVYFQLLELIATNVDTDNQADWGFLPEEYDEQFLTKKLSVDREKYKEILSECIRLKLLELRDERVFCGKVLERCDDYTSQLLRVTSKKLELSSSRIDKKRLDKNRTEEKIKDSGKAQK